MKSKGLILSQINSKSFSSTALMWYVITSMQKLSSRNQITVQDFEETTDPDDWWGSPPSLSPIETPIPLHQQFHWGTPSKITYRSNRQNVKSSNPIIISSLLAFLKIWATFWTTWRQKKYSQPKFDVKPFTALLLQFSSKPQVSRKNVPWCVWLAKR